MKAGVALIALLYFTPSLARADFYAFVGEADGKFDMLDITTGKSTLLGSNGTSYAGLAFGPGGTLYGSTFGQGGISTLMKVDPATGANTIVGSVGFGLTTLTSLADGSLFGVDFSSHLISINPVTGAGTIVGSTGLPNLVGNSDNSLASDGTHLYYTMDQNGSTSTLYTLDPRTGTPVAIGDTGVNGILGSAFASTSPTNGTLFGFGSNGTIYTIDTTTGAATVFGSSGIADFFGGVGIIYPSTIPEPTSLALLLLGGIGLGGLALKRRRTAC